MSYLLALYQAQFKTTIANQFQYRGALVIWLLGQILGPVVLLVVWTTVARSEGGEIDGYTTGALAAYFLATMLVEHATFTWVMWEFDFRVRQGNLSPLLLRPVHPIHKDIAENVTYKLLTFSVVLPAVAVLALLFRPSFPVQGWAILAFVPALAFAFGVRFAIEWTLALAAFWTTRTSAINQTYYVLFAFLSGQALPLALLPPPLQALAEVLPFRWMLGFPVELLLGRLTPAQALAGFGMQAAWLLVALSAMRVIWARGLRQYSAVGA